MSFNWEDYLSLANELSSNSSVGGNEEAKKRSAISRAYYAAFINARNKILPSIGNPPNWYRNGSHNWYIDGYLTKGWEGRQVQRKLKSLKRRRKRADYDNSFRNISEELKAALRESKKILEVLNALTI